MTTLKVVCTGYENQGVCVMCGGPLGKRRRVYCGEECADLYLSLFFWPRASWDAIHRANHKCQVCGVTSDGTRAIHGTWYEKMGLRVHHIIPLNGQERRWHPLNIPANLLVVCYECHVVLGKRTPKSIQAAGLTLLPGFCKLFPMGVSAPNLTFRG